MQMSTSEQEYDIRAFFRALHHILSQTWSGMIVAQKVFKSVNVCFIMHLLMSYRKYLTFWDFCILLVSPIASSTTFSFVLHKSPLSMLFTQNVHQRECYSANFALYISSEKCFFCFVNFDVHVTTTDVTAVLGLVSQSLLSEAVRAGTEYLSISLKHYIPPCSLT